ncbi:MAG: ABC transporter permease [Faecalibacillus sp.]
MIAFTMSFDDFIISYFVTGKGIKNLSIMVYTMSKRVNPSINAISTLIVIFITIVLILVNVVPVIREKEKFKRQNLKKKKSTKNYCWNCCSMCMYGTSFVQKQLLRLKNMQDKLTCL